MSEPYYMVIELSEEERELVKSAAKADRQSVSAWIRQALMVQAECAIDCPMPARRGRPRAELDPLAVDRALQAGGSRRQAARLLGIPHSTLDRWCNRNGRGAKP